MYGKKADKKGAKSGAKKGHKRRKKEMKGGALEARTVQKGVKKGRW